MRKLSLIAMRSLWLATLVVLLGVLVLGSTSFILNKRGTPLIVVTGGSMEPTIHKGSALIVENSKDLEVGDVGVFIQQEGNLITHRVVDIVKPQEMSEKYPESGVNTLTEDGYITLGDANASIDGFFQTKANIYGEAGRSFPLVGYILVFLDGPASVLFLLCLVIALYFLPWSLPPRDEGEDAPAEETLVDGEPTGRRVAAVPTPPASKDYKGKRRK